MILVIIESSFPLFFCCVRDLQSQKLIGTSHRKKGLYILDELQVSAAVSVDLSSFHLSNSSSSFYL